MEDMHRPLIIAHRGLTDATAAIPNTLESILAAIAEGADIVEMDLRVTKDQVIVLHHDPTIAVGEQSFEIKNYTYDELIAAGARIDRLEDVISKLPASLTLDLDLKVDTLDLPVSKVIEAHHLHNRIILDSSSVDVLARLSQFYPDIPMSLSSSTTHDPFHISQTFFAAFLLFVMPRLLRYPLRTIFRRRIKKLFPSYVSVLATICKRADVDLFHSLGIKVFVYTINKEKNMRKFIDMGVDGIKTNRTGVLREVLEGTRA